MLCVDRPAPCRQSLAAPALQALNRSQKMNIQPNTCARRPQAKHPPTSAGRAAQALRICTSGGETLVMQWAMSSSVMHQAAAVGRQAACSPSRKRPQKTNRRKPPTKPKKTPTCLNWTHIRQLRGSAGQHSAEQHAQRRWVQLPHLVGGHLGVLLGAGQVLGSF